MIGLNPGNVTRLIHDEVMTRWIYPTTDTLEEILDSQNYLRYANAAPSKIEPGDYIVIQSKPIDGSFKLIELYAGYNEEEEKLFPIFIKAIDVLTGKVAILSGLEDYIEDEETGD